MDEVKGEVERWGAELYGNPCNTCGYDWSITPLEAIAIAVDMPRRFREALVDCTGEERHPELTWGPIAYTCHVADNFRTWGEGLAAAVSCGHDVPVPGYDPDMLAVGRRYEKTHPEAALLSLEYAVTMWSQVVRDALQSQAVLQHAYRGVQRAEDVARNNAHDASHHLWDIARILQAGDGADQTTQTAVGRDSLRKP